MIRRLSTKWVLTVLAAVLLPFLGFAWFVNFEMQRRHWESVEYYLLTMAGEMADRLDQELHERQLDIELWTTTTPLTEWTLGEYGGDELAFVPTLRGGFNRFIASSRVFDLILAVNPHGEYVVSNDQDADGRPFGPEVLDGLRRDYRAEPWFERAMGGEAARVDHHKSDLLPPRETAPGPHPQNFHIGFAVPVRSTLEPGKVVGVVYGLMNWSHIQHQVLRPTRPRLQDRDGPDLYSSSYAWLWLSDGDTIIAHPARDLYTRRVSQPPVNLPQLAEATRHSSYGMYPEYAFRGVRKTAAFKRCAPEEQGGFGWVAGIGIDNSDVTATADELTDLLTKATALVLLAVVLGTIVIARRTTRPIRELEAQTRRVAAGDLGAHVEARGGDELGDLARSFNEMTAQLSESRDRLVKAEKVAAWREMARQVAHEIKNPLTPVQLSVNLLRRARAERSPDFDAIFDRTTDLIQRQVENMRQIAADFSVFAGARTPELGPVELRALADEVLALNAAWAEESRVEVHCEGGPALVRADRHELRRVLINLVNNALEAMSGGGKLEIRVETRAGATRREALLEVGDSGAGLSETARARLFEPYFTTRTHGTGLGLAIARRIVEEAGGTITLEPRPVGTGPGTLARIVLPLEDQVGP